MSVRKAICLGAVVAMLAALGAQAAAGEPAADLGPLTSSQLVYPGLQVEFLVDVNGAAVAQLLGPALDAGAEVAHKLAASFKQQAQSEGWARAPGVSLAAVPLMAEQLIDPAKDLLKSFTRATLVVMKSPDAGKSPEAEAVIGYYENLMLPRGWVPMVTVRPGSRQEGLLLLLAPGGKGVFGALRPNSRELVVGMVAANRPIGELLGELVRAGGQLAPRLLESFSVRRPVPERSSPPAALIPTPPGAQTPPESPDEN
jgi:hypothetical protein